MSNFDVTNMTEGYDEAPVNYNVSEPLPRGSWWPMRVVDVRRRPLSTNGVPNCNILAEVTAGPTEGRKVLLTGIYLGASSVKRVDGEFDSDGRPLQVAKTEEEMAKAVRGQQGRIKGILSAFGLPPQNDNVVLSPESDDYLFDFFGFDNLVGQEGMVQVGLDRSGDFNTINGCKPLDDPKHGLEAWTRNTLPGLVRQYEREQGSTVQSL